MTSNSESTLATLLLLSLGIPAGEGILGTTDSVMVVDSAARAESVGHAAQVDGEVPQAFADGPVRASAMRFGMDLQAWRDAWLLSLEPQWDLGARGAPFFTGSIGGNNWMRQDSLVREKNFLWGASLGWELAGRRLHAGWTRTRAPGGMVRAVVEGVHVGVARRGPSWDLAIDAIEGHGTDPTMDRRMGTGLLEARRNLHVGSTWRSDAVVGLGWVRTPDQALWGASAGFPVQSAVEGIFLEPSIQWMRTPGPGANIPGDPGIDASDVSQVPVAAGDLHGPLAASLETRWRRLLLPSLGIPYVRDLCVSLHGDAGAWVVDRDGTGKIRPLLSGGAGAGLNLFRGVGSVQFIVGTSNVSGHAGGIVLTTNR